MTNENRNYPLKPPKDTDLPFFAYGIFKPRQLAYSRIKDCVDDYYEYEIDYEMLMRDGVPLIIPPRYKGHNNTIGDLIYFKDKQCAEKAYKTISKTHYEKLYRWEVIKVGEYRANVLMGVNPEMGSSRIEGSMGYYDGRNDPYFKEAIEVAENELYDENNPREGINYFFKLQMSYMLLWTAIERYCSLKYNKAGSKINHLSRDDLFKESLKKHVHSNRIVYSAENLRVYTLDSQKPYDSLRYYYTIRCNVVHRGKAFFYDMEMLKESLTELLNIFKDVLRDTFDEM